MTSAVVGEVRRLLENRARDCEIGIGEHRKTIAALEAELAALERLLGTLEGFGLQRPMAPRPRNGSLILAVLRESVAPLNRNQIFAAVYRTPGEHSKEDALATALWRLKKADKVIRLSDDTYRLS